MSGLSIWLGPWTDNDIDVYLGMEQAVLPTMLAELAPPRVRGGMVSIYWLSIKV